MHNLEFTNMIFFHNTLLSLQVHVVINELTSRLVFLKSLQVRLSVKVSLRV